MIIVKVNSIKSLHGWSVCSQLYSLRAVWVFTAHAHVPHFPIVKTTVHTLSYIDNWYYCTICKSSWLHLFIIIVYYWETWDTLQNIWGP